MITADTVRPLATDLLRVVAAGQALARMAVIAAHREKLTARDRQELGACAAEWEAALGALSQG